MSVDTRKIGGSDIPKLLGISPYGGAAEVFDRIVLGLESPWSPRMDRGVVMEPVLRAHGQNHLRIEIEETESDYHNHPTLDFARAQIDDLAKLDGSPAIVDYKSQSRWAKGWGPAGSDEVPEPMRAQIAWEMACADRDLALLVVGFGDDVPGPEVFNLSHVVTYRVPRDGVFESYCVQVAREFWLSHVVPNVRPAANQIGKRKRK